MTIYIYIYTNTEFVSFWHIIAWLTLTFLATIFGISNPASLLFERLLRIAKDRFTSQQLEQMLAKQNFAIKMNDSERSVILVCGQVVIPWHDWTWFGIINFVSSRQPQNAKKIKFGKNYIETWWLWGSYANKKHLFRPSFDSIRKVIRKNDQNEEMKEWQAAEVDRNVLITNNKKEQKSHTCVHRSEFKQHLNYFSHFVRRQCNLLVLVVALFIFHFIGIDQPANIFISNSIIHPVSHLWYNCLAILCVFA